jgi:hypothetical protein
MLLFKFGKAVLSTSKYFLQQCCYVGLFFVTTETVHKI